jgi:hypothetical protein
MPDILVRLDKVYGVWTLYPANDAAKMLAEIAGTKTLTVKTLQIAQRMGMTLAAQDKPALQTVDAMLRGGA